MTDPQAPPLTETDALQDLLRRVVDYYAHTEARYPVQPGKRTEASPDEKWCIQVNQLKRVLIAKVRDYGPVHAWARRDGTDGPGRVDLREGIVWAPEQKKLLGRVSESDPMTEEGAFEKMLGALRAAVDWAKGLPDW